MEKLYTAKATTKGGRNGHVTSSDKVLDLDLRSPKEMGGTEEGYTNPEQLFAAGYASCFSSAMELMARRKRVNIEGMELTAEVSIGPDPADNGFRLQVEMTADFPKGVTGEQARELLTETHNFCPYSKAIRGNVEVKLHHTIGKVKE